jgi:PleD family two-component response regulator
MGYGIEEKIYQQIQQLQLQQQLQQRIQQEQQQLQQQLQQRIKQLQQQNNIINGPRQSFRKTSKSLKRVLSLKRNFKYLNKIFI